MNRGGPKAAVNRYASPLEQEIPRIREYGVAVRFAGRKRWVEPTDYGKIQDARKELDDIEMNQKEMVGAIVWRYKATAWYEHIEGSMA